MQWSPDSSILHDHYMVLQLHIKNQCPEQTCFLPLTPRCGVARVIKLIGSNPAIIPRLEEQVVFELGSEVSAATSMDWPVFTAISE